MKSNEEYLDELLKSMQEDEAEREAIHLQREDSDEAWENEIELEDNGTSLEQLMAEMQEDPMEETLEESVMSEESIEALLDAAKASGFEAGNTELDEAVEFGMDSQDDIAEIEALLDMSEDSSVMDKNNALLNAFEDSEEIFLEDSDEFLFDENEEREVDIAELDSILEHDMENAAKEKNEQKEKEEGGLKKKFQKLFSMLMEEVPEDESLDDAEMNLSDENRDIMNQLDQEDKKIKEKEKKEKAKKEKKAKPKKEKKPKKAKPKKAKPKKEKKPKKVKDPGPPEKKLPRKKVMVTYLFALSVLAAILLLEFLIPPMLTVNRARDAYNRGDYLEAYKEYYGQKLSEEDEQRFQAATVIMRMQSNLDGYNGYINAGSEVHAIHSLLEAVHVKLDIYAQAEQYGVTGQVETIYQEILNILSTNYNLTEEAAFELVQEKSDVTYTKTLQALADGANYTEESENVISQEDLLPEEEGLFQ